MLHTAQVSDTLKPAYDRLNEIYRILVRASVTGITSDTEENWDAYRKLVRIEEYARQALREL